MFCSKCGEPINPGAAFCSSCGTQVSAQLHALQPVTETVSVTAPASSGDISWGMFAANVVGMLLIAYMTYPIPAELKRPDALVYLLIRVGVPAIFAAIVTGLFYAFRKKKEGRLLKRSFVIASWVMLGLVVLGERGS
jgi:fluoride ion exporter CrcB/FEX